jgi:hypothetical protein
MSVSLVDAVAADVRATDGYPRLSYADAPFDHVAFDFVLALQRRGDLDDVHLLGATRDQQEEYARA